MQIDEFMNKFYILIIVLFGFLLMPTNSFACGNNSNKQSCKEEVSSKTEKDSCCKTDSHSKENKSGDCGGKCGHSNCTTSSVNFSVIPFFEINFKNNSFDFSEEKSKFHHSKTFISSGFTSIWLIPKID